MNTISQPLPPGPDARAAAIAQIAAIYANLGITEDEIRAITAPPFPDLADAMHALTFGGAYLDARIRAATQAGYDDGRQAAKVRYTLSHASRPHLQLVAGA